MIVDQPSVDLGAKLQQLERELVGVREVLARIDAALAGIDPEDVDRLTDEGGRGRVFVVDFSPDARFCAVHRAESVELFRREDGQLRLSSPPTPASAVLTRLPGEVFYSPRMAGHSSPPATKDCSAATRTRLSSAGEDSGQPSRP